MRLLATAFFLAALTWPEGCGAKTIWQNLDSGMTKEQVNALYPKKRTVLGQGCFADLQFSFESKRLSVVRLEWSASDSNSQCGVIVADTLLGKYGEPSETKADTEIGSCGSPYGAGKVGRLIYEMCVGSGVENPRHYSYARWVIGDLEITLKRDTDSENKWWLQYRLRPAVSDEITKKL